MLKNLIALFMILIISACTSIDVRPVDKSHNISHICIENNPKVIVSDFVSIVEDGFEDHGITT